MNPEISILFGFIGTIIIFSPFLIIRIREKVRKLKERKKEEIKIIKICGGLKKPKPKKPKPTQPTQLKPEEWEPPKPIIIPARKIKKPKTPKKKIEIPEIEKRDLSKEKIKSKWLPLIQKLEREGEITIDGNFHFGSLRGYDIALRLKKDLKRLGYNICLEGDEKRCRITFIGRE